MRPLVTKHQLIDFLKSKITKVEIFEDIPTDHSTVRHGIYVSNVLISSTTSIASGFKACGNVVKATDQFDIVMVSFQDDNNLDDSADQITDLPYATILQEYADVSYRVTRSYKNRAEYRFYEFSLERLEQE